MYSPRELAERRVQITADYSTASEELEGILALKPTVWMAIRKGAKSDAAADKEWDATEDGIKEMRLRMALKRYEKQLSSLRTMLEVLEGEARNII